MSMQQNLFLLANHDRLLKQQEKRNTLVQGMPQWHMLDSKASSEMKVKSFKRQKVRKSVQAEKGAKIKL